MYFEYILDVCFIHFGFFVGKQVRLFVPSVALFRQTIRTHTWPHAYLAKKVEENLHLETVSFNVALRPFVPKNAILSKWSCDLSFRATQFLGEIVVRPFVPCDAVPGRNGHARFRSEWRSLLSTFRATQYLLQTVVRPFVPSYVVPCR